MRAVYICECGHHWQSEPYPLGLICGECGDRVWPVGQFHPARGGYAPEDHDDHSSSTGFDRD